MIKVVILGNGNVASHLTDAFEKAKGIEVIQLNSRKKHRLSNIDIVIIAVSDDAITEVSSKIDKNTLVVHTSGSVSINSLKNNGNKGVFYPLQTFSKNRKVDFSEVPFCLEAQNETDLQFLEKLAASIGKNTYHINSSQRKSLHVAAVFVNNFVNHLYKIGNDLCDEYNVPFKILQPLIKETAAKIENLSPEEAQTGPAKRNDEKTIKNHLDLLQTNQQKIYKTLTESIRHGKKL